MRVQDGESESNFHNTRVVLLINTPSSSSSSLPSRALFYAKVVQWKMERFSCHIFFLFSFYFMNVQSTGRKWNVTGLCRRSHTDSVSSLSFIILILTDLLYKLIGNIQAKSTCIRQNERRGSRRAIHEEIIWLKFHRYGKSIHLYVFAHIPHSLSADCPDQRLHIAESHIFYFGSTCFTQNRVHSCASFRFIGSTSLHCNASLFLCARLDQELGSPLSSDWARVLKSVTVQSTRTQSKSC